MGFLNSYAAIGWSSTGDTAPSRVVMLGVPLRQTHPGFSQATYRAQSLDRSTIESLVIPNGAHELVGEIRYQQDSQGLLDMLVAGSANKTLTYYPDVRDPSQSYACKLIEPVGPQIDTVMDPQRNTFGDTSVTIRLRRTDAGPFTEQYIGTNLLLSYRGGGSLQPATYSRATATTQIGPGGTYAAVASGKAATSWYDADADGIRETPGLSLSPERTNLCLQSENFGTTWATVGSPTRSAAAKACGTVTLDLIGDDSAAALEGYTQTITFTGNAVKAVSLVVAQGSSSTSVFRLEDTTAGATRLRGALTWVAGVPTMTMVEGSFLGYERLANGCFRLHFQSTAVTAANTNSMQVYPATTTAFPVANTGTLYVGGVQAENAPSCGPYIPTTTGTVTRNGDSVSLPFNAKANQAATFYARFIELGTIYMTNNTPILSIGASTNPRLFLQFAAGNFYRIISFNAAGSSVQSIASTNPVIGDVVELLGTITATGVVQLSWSVNGGAVTTAAASSAQATGDTWGTAVAYLGSEAGSVGALAGLLNAVALRGVQTMATMRRVARV